MSTVLILGATSDIGFAIAKKFASEGYAVQLAARNDEQLKPLQSDLQIRFNIPCTIHYFDATVFSMHEPFYHSLTPKPDVCVYAIGYMNENEKVVKVWPEALNTINTNYTAAASILNVIANDFKTKGNGAIIGISSVAGKRGRQSNYIYGSAKAGFTAYLSGLRNSLYHSNIHVMTVLPGFVYTRMTENLNLPKLLTAKPEEVAHAVFLGVKKKKDLIYIKWFWRWIMIIIMSIPESTFKKMKL